MLSPQEGRGLVRARHPGSAKIEEFLGQLEALWEELQRRHQRNAVFLQASGELGFRVRVSLKNRQTPPSGGARLSSGRYVIDPVRYRSRKREVHGYDGSFWMTSSHCERAQLWPRALSGRIKLMFQGRFDPSCFNWQAHKVQFQSQISIYEDFSAYKLYLYNIITL